VERRWWRRGLGRRRKMRLLWLDMRADGVGILGVRL
jgi:hypothetical protein